MAITKIITPDLIDLPFNNTDGVVLPKGTTNNTLSIQYLVVAGGGGGGGKSDTGSGGGGAGGLLTATADFASSTNYDVDVGLGGNGGYGSSTQRIGVSGGDSVFDTIVCKGGGGGGAWGLPTTGGTGGSGGGSAYGGAAGQGTSGQGNNGGVGSTGYNQGAGGGGGAGGVGLNGVGDYVSGNGGVGLQNTITGASPTPYYAGGGGGGTFPNNLGQATRSTGGLGGGADGNYNANGIAGDSNTGGGGGGTGSVPNSDGYGGNGGSGVIILRMISTTIASFSTGVTFNLNNTDVAGQNIYTITATTNSSQTVSFTSTVPSTERPTTNLSDGEFRYNITTKKIEFYDGTEWFALTSSASLPQPGTTGACNYPVTASALYQLNDTPNDTCGTYTGVWSGTATYATGKFGKAADFNSSRYITTNVSFDGSTATGSSISFWFNTTNTSLQALIGSATQNGSSYYSTIYLGNATSTFPDESISFWNYDSGGTSVFLAKGGSTTYQDGEWHNCVMVSTSSSKAIYIDGISKTVYYTGSGSVSANANLTNITLAKGGYDLSSTFTGLIDQVRIFPSALTATQASALYTETAP